MRHRVLIAACGLFGLFLLPGLFAGSDVRLDPAGLESISAAELRSIVTFLASDEMDGRDTGSQTNRIAASFLAHHLELSGLRPAGESGSWYQDFGLVRGKLGAGNRLTFRNGAELTELGLMEEFYPSRYSASGRVSGPAAFVGFGVVVPRLGYDDFAGVELRGSIALMFTGEPGGKPDEDDTSAWDLKDEAREFTKIFNAQQRGAVGAVLFRPTKFGARVGYTGRSQWPEDPGRAPLLLEAEVGQIRIPVAVVTVEALEPFFAGDPEAIRKAIEKDRRPASRRLGFEVLLEVDVEQNRLESRNVIGMLEGADPGLRDEFVLVSAHLDHIGNVAGQVYNGADDDASGSAVVLEVAEAFAHGAVRPSRSVLFCFWNAEERGLLGSRYFAIHPTVPISSIRAVLQADMVGRNQEVPENRDHRFAGLSPQKAEDNSETLHLVGYSVFPELAKRLKASNLTTGLRLLEELDDHPLRLIRRSDSWIFLARGIPSLLLTTGLHPDYHSPDDDSDRLNYAKMARIAKLIYLTAMDASSRDGGSGVAKP